MSSIGEMLVSARPFEEYVAMLDLTDDDLAGTVLDCPGGTAGFTATALARAVATAAVAPAHAEGTPVLAALAEYAEPKAERGHQFPVWHLAVHVELAWVATGRCGSSRWLVTSAHSATRTRGGYGRRWSSAGPPRMCGWWANSCGAAAAGYWSMRATRCSSSSPGC